MKVVKNEIYEQRNVNGEMEMIMSTHMVMSLNKHLENGAFILEAIAHGFTDFIKTQKGEELFKLYKPFIEQEIKNQVEAYIQSKTSEIMKSIDLNGIANIASLQAGKNLGMKL